MKVFNKAVVLNLLFLASCFYCHADHWWPYWTEEEAKDSLGFRENVLFLNTCTAVLDSVRYQSNIYLFADNWEGRDGVVIRTSYLDGYLSENWTSGRVDVSLGKLEHLNGGKSTYGYYWGYADSLGLRVEDVYYLNKDNVYLKYGADSNYSKNAKSQFLRIDPSVYSFRGEEKMPTASRCRLRYDNMMVIKADTIFMMYSDVIYKTLYGGEYGSEYWNEYIPDLDPAPEEYIGMEKSESGYTYFLAYIAEVENENRLYIARSTDYGQSWESSYVGSEGENYQYDFEFLDKDTYLIAQNRNDAADTCICLLKSTDMCQSFDTLFADKTYSTEKPILRVFGEKHDKYIISTGNRCTAISINAGQSFDILIDKDDVINQDAFDIYYVDVNTFVLWSRASGWFMQYKPTVAVEDGEIEKFKTKLFPNPALRASKIYISLENDKHRPAVCRIFDINGNMIRESRELQIPRGYHTIDFTVEGYVPGAYFMVIESEGVIICKERFVVKK